MYLKVAVCGFFLYLIVFYEPPNIHNLALVGLYSMMFAFLLSLNFNIWQFATKHICYSNIYTTYIAIYVTSQQKNGFKLKNKQQQNKNKTKNSLQNGSEGAARVITKFGTEKSVHESAVRDVTVQLKKRRASDTFSDYWRHDTHCLLFQVYLFFFL